MDEMLECVGWGVIFAWERSDEYSRWSDKAEDLARARTFFKAVIECCRASNLHQQRHQRHTGQD
jgi:hypothetical protein